MTSPSLALPTAFVVMGVSGCGKSALSRALHEQLLAAGHPARWLEGDDFHPAANVEKMRQGQPLNDTDRAPWLAELNAQMRQALAQGQSAVLACSALKASYRQVLREGIGRFVLIHPHGPFELIESRMKARQHKYMPASLLRSQFDTLEMPDDAIRLDIHESIAALAGRLKVHFGLEMPGA